MLKSLSPPVCLFVCLSVLPSCSLSPPLCFSSCVCLFIFLSILLSVCLSLHNGLSLSVSLQYVCLSVCLSYRPALSPSLFFSEPCFLLWCGTRCLFRHRVPAARVGLIPLWPTATRLLRIRN